MYRSLKFLGAGALFAAFLCSGDASAQTFPSPPAVANPFWIPMTRGGNPIADPATTDADSRDIVGDATHSATYIASDANYLYLRLRLNGSPGAVGAIPDGHGYGCEIKLNGAANTTTYDLLLTLDGNGTDAIKLDWNKTTATANTSAEPAELAVASIASTATNTRITATSDTTNSANPDAFVDYAISWATFRTPVGGSPAVTSATTLRFICGTSVTTTNANDLAHDIFDGAATLVLANSWSDAYTCNNGGNPRCVTTTDVDGDGIQAATEATLGTSATNFDSDGDGLPDYFEALAPNAVGDVAFTKVDTDSDGKIDALDTDSDNDCVPDSVEGLATYRDPTLPTTNLDAACTTGTAPICDTHSGTCSACNGDNASGQPLACPSATSPVCQTAGALAGSCTACSTAEVNQCTTGGAPACESTTGACSACNGDNGSNKSAVCPTTAAPACNTSGANAGHCTECNPTNVGLCPTQSPACAEDTGACAACTGDNGATTNAPCPSGAAPACNLAGAFVGRCTVCSATNTTLCPTATPACDTGGGVCSKCDGDSGTGTALQCPNATAPLCVLTGTTQGSCIKCQTSNDCGTGHAGPTCDKLTGGCVDIDTDKDGLQDEIEVLLGTNPNNPDSDGDTIGDKIEVTPVGGGPFEKVDTDGDGVIDALDTDSDNDLVLDKDEVGPVLTLPADTDGDGTPDFRDIDDDNDAIATMAEITDAKNCGVDDDVDGDGKKNWVDSDANGNGIKDGSDGRGDNDHDGILNYLDLTPDGEIVVVDSGAPADSGASSTSSSSGTAIVSTGDAGASSGNDETPEEQGVIEGSGGCNSSGAPVSSLVLGAGVIALALASRRRRT